MALASLLGLASYLLTSDALCTDNRPPPSVRTFQSRIVDEAVDKIALHMEDPELACIFRNAFPNCLDTTVYSFINASETGEPRVSGSCSRIPGICSRPRADVEDTFIVTGDIEAMWLRDSTNQVLPYMRFALQDLKLQAMLRGLLRRQTHQIHTDAYANAHNIDRTTGLTPNANDHTTKPSFLNTHVSAMTPSIFERKYELDSLCAFLKLGAEYYSSTADASPFDDFWAAAVGIVVDVMKSQQKPTLEDDGIYSFQRCSSCEPTDTLTHGVGFPGASRNLVRTAFRPSDDAAQYPYLVPANAMAVVELRRTAHLLKTVRGDLKGHDHLLSLAASIDQGIQNEAVVMHRHGDRVYAYEVDGYGNAYHMDDANVPSLLSLPYLGYLLKNDSLYSATRKVILSPETNPYYFAGSVARGVGSPHTGLNRIWPMSIIVQALTSNDDQEIRKCLDMLKASAAQSGFMHESFDRNDAGSYSRPWFSWANSLFGELIVRLAQEKPHLIYKQDARSQAFV